MKFLMTPDYDSDNTMNAPDVMITPYEGIVTIELAQPRRLVKILKKDWLVLMHVSKRNGD